MCHKVNRFSGEEDLVLDEAQPSVAVETDGIASESTELEGPELLKGPQLIVGLGNPGAKYQDTRHNYGFLVIDELARRSKLVGDDICSCEHYRVALGGQEARDVHFAKPMTFMNRSGLSVRCLAQRFGFEPESVLVVYDDVSLPFTKQRLRAGGSAGGHRGLESVIENLRTDRVPRLRLGIAPESTGGGQEGDFAEPDASLVDFVLEPFRDDQRTRVSLCVSWAADACEAWLRYGIDRTMNQFNGALPLGDG